MRIFLCLALLVAGCTDSRDVMDELPNSSLAGAAREDVPESRMEAPLARAVTIGEDGPRLDACSGMGQVARVGAPGLALRAAPFADAQATAQLAAGARLHLCTRSLDQRWIGVVVAPSISAGDQPVDCGLSSPVERKQAYMGVCASGWVASAYVQSIAG